MVNDEGVAQLSDFGLATVEPVIAFISGSTSNSGGNPRWLAPELMFPGLFNGTGQSTRESDFYAFGMTALEVRIRRNISLLCHIKYPQLFTEKVPFHDMLTSALPLEIAVKGLKPEWPGPDAESRGLSPWIWKRMRNCWKHEPASRAKTRFADLVGFQVSSVQMTNLRVTSASGDKSSRFKTLGIIMEGPEPSEKDGWFANVWNIKYTNTARRRDIRSCRNVSARIVNMSRQDIRSTGVRLSSFPISLLVDYLDFHLPVQILGQFQSTRNSTGHNIARFIGISDVILPMASALIFAVGPTAELLLDYFRRKTKNRETLEQSHHFDSLATTANEV